MKNFYENNYNIGQSVKFYHFYIFLEVVYSYSMKHDRDLHFQRYHLFHEIVIKYYESFELSNYQWQLF